MRLILALLLAPVGSLVALMSASVESWADVKDVNAALYSFTLASESVGFAQIAGFMFVGIALGIVAAPPAGSRGQVIALLVGAGAVSPFPVLSILDLTKGGSSSHNLLLVEWVFFAVYGLIVAGGVGIGGRLLTRDLRGEVAAGAARDGTTRRT